MPRGLIEAVYINVVKYYFVNSVIFSNFKSEFIKLQRMNDTDSNCTVLNIRSVLEELKVEEEVIQILIGK